MKINLFQEDYATLYQKSCSIIRSMQFIIQNDNMNTGLISAFMNTGQSRILDIKFKKINSNIAITILPGLLSSDFETINYDEGTAVLFVEKLYNSLKTEVESNSFRLNEEDYVAAMI